MDSGPSPANIWKHWTSVLTIYVKLRDKEKSLVAKNEEGLLNAELNWGFVTCRSKQTQHQVFLPFGGWGVQERGTRAEAIGPAQVGKLN